MAREGDTLTVGGGFIDVDPSTPCSLGHSSAFAINVIEPGHVHRNRRWRWSG